MTPEELRKWRERRGYTQEEAYAWYTGRAAKNAGRIWRRWEHGDRKVPAPLARLVELSNRRTGR